MGAGGRPKASNFVHTEWSSTKPTVQAVVYECACLLAHSVLGSLKRPKDVQPNDFRFLAVELFVGTARSPNSATTLLNALAAAATATSAFIDSDLLPIIAVSVLLPLFLFAGLIASDAVRALLRVRPPRSTGWRARAR